MKSISDQYKQLNEGTLGQAQFLRNVRMALPKFVTNVTSFKDAVKILKNKGIISEAKSEPQEYGMPNEYCNPQEYDLGMRYELDKGTDEEKADKIVCKNLKNNASYYSQLHLAGYNEDAMKTDRKKRTDLPIEVKKDNFVDAANGVKKVKIDTLNETLNLSEALNKDIKAFGQDLERRLKSAGIDSLITFQTPTQEQEDKVAQSPNLAIMYVTQTPDLQGLQLRANIKVAKQVAKILSMYQFSDWHGPVQKFGQGFDTKTKQVMNTLNPGEITASIDQVGMKTGSKFFDARFFRYANTGAAKVKTDTLTEDELKVLINNVLSEVMSFSEFRKIRKQIADLKADTTADHSKEIADLEAKLPKRDDTVKQVDNSWVANFYDQPSKGRNPRYKGD